MTAAHCRRHGSFTWRPDRQQRERGHSVKRDIPPDRQALRGGDCDPQTGKAPGADADDDLRGHMAAEHVGNQRHQPFGMAPADDLVS
jgi:hypothetical protein